MNSTAPQQSPSSSDSQDSLGLVTPQSVVFNEPFVLACGRELSQFELVYETYGTLNASRSNAVLICHALSGNHHAAGRHSADDRKPGWWDHYVGPGKPIDTNCFFVVCANNIGGCDGSTGPNTINPETNTFWANDFPRLRVRDWVHSQHRLMTHLHINQWAAVVGGSLGGMQAQRWSLEYPDKLRHCVIIASAMRLSAQNIAFNNIARQAILNDPEFHDGRYLDKSTAPKLGLSVARMVGHVTYISEDTMADRFGRELRKGSFTQGVDEDIEFQIESYLHYQGNSFSEKFDANTYLLLTRALEFFDLAREYNHDPIKAFEHATCKFFVVAFSSDWRFSPERSRDMVQAMLAAKKQVTYVEVQSDYGHDAFLVPNERYEQNLRTYLSHVAKECGE
ncbi:MAG: homoserine O-acetyltransferase [Pseudomonadota bacterium]